MGPRGEAWVLEAMISQWRTFVRRQRAIDAMDMDELEDHLRSQIADLREAGLDAEEAFLIGIKRIGRLDTLSKEYAREHSERLWKRLVLDGEGRGDATSIREAVVALGLAVGAAIAIKLPSVFGLGIEDGGPAAETFYLRNLSLFALPFLAAFFAWKRGMDAGRRQRLALPFFGAAAVMNIYPFEPGDTLTLAALHLPIALWFAMGVGYAAGDWRDHSKRMDFIRFTGEWFIYYVLIALGGGVFMAFTLLLFQAVGVDAEWLINRWILPCGVVGAVVVAGWLVEAKQSVVENMAPVLTMIFTPLFTLLLAGFLVTVAWIGVGIDRDLLIVSDLLLVLVTGLILYNISARDPQAPPNLFDLLGCALVIVTLLVDAVALWAILERITTWGFTPNRTAALGENIVLVVSLAWTAVLYVRFLRGDRGFADLERWQTTYLPVYGLWAAVVVVVFPVMFGFR